MTTKNKHIETVEQFLARGGEVIKIMSPKYDKELNPGKLKIKAGNYGRGYKITKLKKTEAAVV